MRRSDERFFDFGALDLGGVQLGRAIHEGDRAETVEHSVVNSVEPEVAVVFEVQHRRGDEAVTEDVDRGAVVGPHPVLSGLLRIRLPAQIHVSERIFEAAVDELARLGVDLDYANEAGLQFECGTRLAASEQIEIEGTAKIDVLSDVGWYRRIDVLSEPHAELRGRERKCGLGPPMTRRLAFS